MKKIGLLLSAPCSGSGVSQYCKSVLTALLALPRDEYSLVVAYRDPAWNHLLEPGVETLPLRLAYPISAVAILWNVLRLPHKLWLRRSRFFFRAVRDVADQNCDLWIFPCQDLWSSSFPVPAIAAIHDLMHRYEWRFPEAGGFGRRWYRDSYLRHTCRNSSAILVDSELGQRHVIESYGPETGKVIVLPYVPPSYIFESPMQEDFNAKYDLPRKFLFYPAQFWPHKNHMRLVGATARARARCTDITLILSGTPDKEYSRVKSRANELGVEDCIHFVGYIPENDISEFYRRARALIFPTFFGPTNIPPLEAFALGCPVAVSNIYGMPEQVGDAARLFDPASEQDMADCIIRLWQDDELCRSLSARGRAKARLWGPHQFAAALRAHIDRFTVAAFAPSFAPQHFAPAKTH